MSEPLSDDMKRQLRAAFRMPSVQTMVSRKSSITNAFVNALIPVIEPTPEEIAEALALLGMSCDAVSCACCGDRPTEWDHLRPLVVNRRPTGFISEIANLVPSCGKCNQSKGNQNWLAWITGSASRSPAVRGVPGLEERVARLKAFEAWRPVRPVPFEELVGREDYERYWALMDQSIGFLKQCQVVADDLKRRIADAHRA